MCRVSQLKLLLFVQQEPIKFLEASIWADWRTRNNFSPQSKCNPPPPLPYQHICISSFCFKCTRGILSSHVCRWGLFTQYVMGHEQILVLLKILGWVFKIHHEYFDEYRQKSQNQQYLVVSLNAVRLSRQKFKKWSKWTF